ncbi:hypothetical protein tloyanaT_04040 [Thalassotalea loyana]|uniref:HEAT repeat domain-containing protein n=1 Tax=Thalassotalea loyana TaxID=280483 RepID=A0ABQ6HBJ7_9GAMM|nr:hypothetical protein [Thalassotalea loyana]GLX84152.1 hypothetical protein tloyanaT_04040 [Thalassotalea loyana]
MSKRTWILLLIASVIITFIFKTPSSRVDIDAATVVIESKRKLPNHNLAPQKEQIAQNIAEQSRYDIEHYVEQEGNADALSCLPNITFDQTNYQEEIDSFFVQLGKSTLLDNRLYYALFAELPDSKAKFELLYDYYLLDPSQPLIANQLINLCTTVQDAKCTDDFIIQLVSVDDNNGHMWMNVAFHFAQHGDDENVIYAIDRLTKTSTFNERFGEQALMYARALEGSNANSFNLNAVAGIGKVAAISSNLGALLRWCDDNRDSNSAQMSCLTLGEQLATRSKTKLNQMFGLTLQKDIYQQLNRQDMVSNIAKILDNPNRKLPEDKHINFEIMLMLDESLLRRYLANIDVYGEEESIKLSIEEAKALHEKDNNHICSLAHEMLESADI